MRLFGSSLATIAVNVLLCSACSRSFRAACVSFDAPYFFLYLVHTGPKSTQTFDRTSFERWISRKYLPRVAWLAVCSFVAEWAGVIFGRSPEPRISLGFSVSFSASATLWCIRMYLRKALKKHLIAFVSLGLGLIKSLGRLRSRL